MEWLYTKKRGPEWKQGWTGQTMASISTPSFHLLIVFAIVVFFLWFSQLTAYRAQRSYSSTNYQLLLVLLPILFVLFVASTSTGGLLKNFRSRANGSSSSSPWGIAMFVALLLVLLFYQSSFHSNWFGPLWRSA